MLDRTTTEAGQAALLQRIAAQDRAAFGEFYDQLAGTLFAVSVRILGDPHEAEEVIQDVFVQIWQRAATFDPALGSAFHWALSIARNRSIDRLRGRERRARLAEEAQGLSEIRVEEAGQMLGEEEIAAIRASVGSLPQEQRQAIELAFFGGLTHLEIASRLNEPLGTVKARIRRGMMKLRESMQAYA